MIPLPLGHLWSLLCLWESSCYLSGAQPGWSRMAVDSLLSVFSLLHWIPVWTWLESCSLLLRMSVSGTQHLHVLLTTVLLLCSAGWPHFPLYLFQCRRWRQTHACIFFRSWIVFCSHSSGCFSTRAHSLHKFVFISALFPCSQNLRAVGHLVEGMAFWIRRCDSAWF